MSSIDVVEFSHECVCLTILHIFHQYTINSEVVHESVADWEVDLPMVILLLVTY